jgi:hypothetical protein
MYKISLTKSFLASQSKSIYYRTLLENEARARKFRNSFLAHQYKMKYEDLVRCVIDSKRK